MSLKIKTKEQASKEALAKIKKSMEEDQPGLVSRWPVINRVAGGVFRFGELHTIAGLSGSGKSYFLNMLREDFANAELNGEFMKRRKYKILSFSFEMSSADEIIRTLSSETGISYSDIMSMDKKISQEFYEELEYITHQLTDNIIFYVEKPGNVNQMWNTVEEFNKRYPEHQLVVMLDHTLLAAYLKESSEVELVNRVSRFGQEVKKTFGALVIFLSQLRDDIEGPDRITNPTLHYPKRRDIYGSKQVFMYSDVVGIIHRPRRLGIEKYGPQKIPTVVDDKEERDLVVYHVIKGRLTGMEGIVKFRNDFDKGTMTYLPSEEEQTEEKIKSSNPFGDDSE